MILILAGLSAAVSPALLSALLVRIAPERDLRVSYLAVARTLLIAGRAPA
jgi:hypothetical protein